MLRISSLMFRGFVDTNATELQALVFPEEVHFDIPLLDDFVRRGPLVQPRLYVILGESQTYKTTLAVDILRPFIGPFQALWIDADFRFPIDLLRTRDVDLSKLKITSPRSTEEILYTLLAVSHQMTHTNDMVGLRCIVIDGLNSSHWIDDATKKVTDKNPFWKVVGLIEKLVASYGISVIVVMQHLYDDPWKSTDESAYDSITLKLKCAITAPETGQVSCNGFLDRFRINENREFQWGRRALLPE